MRLLIDGEGKLCSKCGEFKSLYDFHKDSTNPSGRAYWCKECANAGTRKYHAENKDDPEYRRKRRNQYCLRTYGITVDAYEERLRQQDSKCAICKVELQPDGNHTHLDHCHNTDKLRAFLCTNCNRGLGHFQDSPNLLRRAADYLNDHSLDDD